MSSIKKSASGSNSTGGTIRRKSSVSPIDEATVKSVEVVKSVAKPTASELILATLEEIGGGRIGVSRHAIFKHLKDKYGLESNHHVKFAHRKLIEKGIIISSSLRAGHFRIAKRALVAVKKPSKKVKVVTSVSEKGKKIEKSEKKIKVVNSSNSSRGGGGNKSNKGKSIGGNNSSKSKSTSNSEDRGNNTSSKKSISSFKKKKSTIVAVDEGKSGKKKKSSTSSVSKAGKVLKTKKAKKLVSKKTDV